MDLFATLNINENMGVPERLIKSGNTTTAERNIFSLDDNQALRDRNIKSDEEELLSPSAVHLLHKLTTSNIDSVTINYSLEPTTVATSRPHERSVHIRYEQPAPTEPIPFLLTKVVTTTSTSTLADVEHIAGAFMSNANFITTTGTGTDMVHATTTNTKSECEMVLLAMWLIHLDIVAGTDICIEMDNNAVKRWLPINTPATHEANECRSIDGVRVHWNSTDITGRALLHAACYRNSLTNSSVRVSRYNWPCTPLTLYGTQAPLRRTILRDPQASASAIQTFTRKYGLMQQSAQALQTALMLYGTVNSPRKIEFNIGKQTLYEEVHKVKDLPYAPERVNALTKRSLVSLSMFVATGINQTWNAVIRTQVTKTLLVEDSLAAIQTMRMTNEIALNAIGSTCAKAVKTYVEPLFDVRQYVFRNMVNIVRTHGVLHAITMGRIITDSILDKVTQPISVAETNELERTDKLEYAKLRKAEWKNMFIVNELIKNGGQTLNTSYKALNKIMGKTMVLDKSITSYVNQRVQLIVHSIGDTIELTIPKTEYIMYEPAPPEIQSPVEIKTASNFLSGAIETKPLSADMAAIQSLLVKRGVPAPTLFKHKRPKSADSEKESVTSQPDIQVRCSLQAAPAVFIAEENKWGPEPTSGANLLCGAKALLASIVNYNAITVEPNIDPTEEDVILELAKTYENTENVYIANLASEPLLDREFTAEQLTMAAQALGVNLIIAQPTSDGIQTIDLNTLQLETKVLIYHNGAGHWESIGPNTKRKITAL